PHAMERGPRSNPGRGGELKAAPLVDHPLIALPIGRAQVLAEDLARGIARQGLDHVDAARSLEGRDTFACPGDDVALLDRHARLWNDNRLYGFAPFRVGDADHRDLLHRRVTIDRALDLSRIDILTARDDHVLHPVVDIEI